MNCKRTGVCEESPSVEPVSPDESEETEEPKNDASCKKDVDCEGDEICKNNKCTAPKKKKKK